MESGCAGLQAGTPDCRRRTVVTRTGVIRGPAGDLCPCQAQRQGGPSCKQWTKALKIAGCGSLPQEGVKVSWNVPGRVPGAPVKDDTEPCACCGHRADSHLNTGSCSVRGRWRRCRCSCYAASDPAARPAAGPGSPHDGSFMASRPARREPAPGRQEDEQPPHQNSPGESRKRRILGKAADVATDAADAAIEMLANLLP